ncbi:hypothetical protein B0H13DRAFT_1093965 [Mycena leptocephala]|nr:hypothetical protein B0H13DRAFT_1093965 [Mycena leptocephala]
MPPPPSSFTSRRHLAPKTLTLTASTPHARACVCTSSPKNHTSTRAPCRRPSRPHAALPHDQHTDHPPSTVSRTLSTKDTRRRHAAKLARTLGENIAPELVVEAPARPSLHRAPAASGTRTPPQRPSLRHSSRLHPHPHLRRTTAWVAVTPPLPSQYHPARVWKTTTLARSFSTATRAPRSTVDRAKSTAAAGALRSSRSALRTASPRRKRARWRGRRSSLPCGSTCRPGSGGRRRSGAVSGTARWMR